MKNMIKTLIQFYKALSHYEVIKLIEENVDLYNFNILQDKYYKIYIPKKISKPAPCLCAHTDTVHLHSPKTIKVNKKKLSAMGGLGADDRNGCWLIHQMMLKRPDDFIFAVFDLEEHSCTGSQSFDPTSIYEKVSVFIGLDRKGKSELALYGYENHELLEILTSIEGYHPDYGTMTDVAVLSENTGICCFNISVGFYNQHSLKEYTNINHLRKAERLLLNLPRTLWHKQFMIDFESFLDEEPYFDPYNDPFFDLKIKEMENYHE